MASDESNSHLNEEYKKVKSKAIPVTGRGGP
jgi:hypothetical protein